jgi:hypothetical protein
MIHNKNSKSDSKHFFSLIVPMLILAVAAMSITASSAFLYTTKDVFGCVSSSEELHSPGCAPGTPRVIDNGGWEGAWNNPSGSSNDDSSDDGSGSDGGDGSSDGGYDGGDGSSDGGYDGGDGSSDGGYDGGDGSSDGGYDGGDGSSDGGYDGSNSPISPGQLQCELCGSGDDSVSGNSGSPISPGQLQCELCGSGSGYNPDLTYHPDLGSPYDGTQIPQGGTPPPNQGSSQPSIPLPPWLQWAKDHFFFNSGIPHQGQPNPAYEPDFVRPLWPKIGPIIGGWCFPACPPPPPPPPPISPRPAP